MMFIPMASGSLQLPEIGTAHSGGLHIQTNLFGNRMYIQDVQLRNSYILYIQGEMERQKEKKAKGGCLANRHFSEGTLLSNQPIYIYIHHFLKGTLLSNQPINKTLDSCLYHSVGIK